MKSLGDVADRQTPALQNLDASAPADHGLLRPPRAVRAGLAPGDPLARPGVGHRRQGGEGGRADGRPAQRRRAGHAGGLEGPRDDPRAPRRPQERDREGPAQPRRRRATRASRRCCSTSTTRRRRRRSTTRTATSSRSPCSPSECAQLRRRQHRQGQPVAALRSAARSSARTSPGSRREDITTFSDPRSDTARNVARRRSEPAAPPKLPAAPSLPVPTPKAPAANEPAPSRRPCRASAAAAGSSRRA